METLSINFQAATRDGGFGLKHFISEIRNSKSKDEERVRVDKELANIRQKFANTANLTSYQKKKYVSKLCYIYMLGYDVDFGHMEFISLLSSTKFSEKSVGYLAFSLMLRPGDELMTLVLNSMRNDIVGQINFGQTLALATVANMGGVHLAETLSADVQRLVIRYVEMGGNYSSMTGPGGIPAESIARNHAFVVKKACLCMLHLFRFNPDSVIPDEWKKNLARLLEDRDLGVVTSTMSLMQALVAHSPSAFEDLVPYVISILNRLVVNRSCIPDYYYYQIPSPWLQVKCLRVLQNYKLPEGTQQDLLFEILTRILVKSDVAESGNRSNADNSVLLEAVNLVISYGADANSTLKSQIGAILGRFLTYKDANIRYLGLDAMTRLAKADGAEAVHMHQRTVLDSMKDIDISVKKRALNLLYVMTDKSNAKDIVGELVAILEESESAIKEDMVVKIAILAEKFSSGDLEWYINTLVQVR